MRTIRFTVGKGYLQCRNPFPYAHLQKENVKIRLPPLVTLADALFSAQYLFTSSVFTFLLSSSFVLCKESHFYALGRFSVVF